MSTSSNIAILKKDGTVTEVYCHWDGYPEYNGHMLLKYYNTPEKAKELIALGDLSGIGEVILHPAVEKYGFDFRINPEAKEEYGEDQLFRISSCVAYHRDRNNPFNQDNYNSFEKYTKEADFTIVYRYLFDEKTNTWYLVTKNKAQTLSLDENEDVAFGEKIKLKELIS